MWFSQSSSTGALGAAPCGVGEGQGLVDAFGVDFVLGQLEVGVDARRQAQLRKLVDAAFGDELVAIGGGAGVEPEPAKPEE